MSSPDPVRLCDGMTTFGAFGSVKSDVVHLAEDLVVLQEAGRVAVEGRMAAGAPQTLRVPAFITNLNIFE